MSTRSLEKPRLIFFYFKGSQSVFRVAGVCLACENCPPVALRRRKIPKQQAENPCQFSPARGCLSGRIRNFDMIFVVMSFTYLADEI